MIICIHQRYFVQRVYPIEFVNRSVGILQGGEGGWVGDHRGDPRTARSAKLLRWKFTWRYIDLKLLFAVDLKYTFTSKNLLPVFSIFYLVLFQSVLDASVTKGRLMCSTQCSLSENFLKWDISAKTRVLVFSAKTNVSIFLRDFFFCGRFNSSLFLQLENKLYIYEYSGTIWDF